MTHRDRVMPEVRHFLNSHVVDGWKVLEVGYGYREDFKKEFEAKEMIYTAIDRDKVADKRDYEVFGMMEDMRMFKDKEFDLVFCCHAFEHCEHPIEALKEFRRVSKKFIFIITPNYCIKQIREGDIDHIFVLTEMQMSKLFSYLNISHHIYKTLNENIGDIDMVTIGDLS